MTAPGAMGEDRAVRERQAYDEGRVLERSRDVHRRFSHVFLSPNSRRAGAMVEEWMAARARGKRVLDIGCGRGDVAARAIDLGASYALGLDVSRRSIAAARRREVPGRLEFEERDVSQPLEGVFDLIHGDAILHHIEYRGALRLLHERNLAPGGCMVFREPLGSSLLMRLWGLLGRAAHTPDERPLYLRDLRWLRREFPGIRMFGVNYLSFPAGMISSLLLGSPDNALLRWADRADQVLHERLPWLRHRFRQAVLIIEKPGEGGPALRPPAPRASGTPS